MLLEEVPDFVDENITKAKWAVRILAGMHPTVASMLSAQPLAGLVNCVMYRDLVA